MKHQICVAALVGIMLGHSLFAGERSSEWIGKPAPELGKGAWINSPPLALRELRGHVVLLEFWTFGCENCLHTLSHVRGWYAKYPHSAFQIIGIHTPEFQYEKDVRAVTRETGRLGITYPVTTDNDYGTWNRYHQQYWPVMYLLDKHGIIRYVHVGEGDYDETQRQIASLLAED